jgi:hypothetical protein
VGRARSPSNGGPSGTGSPAATRSEIRAPSIRCAPPGPISSGRALDGGVVADCPSPRSTRPSVGSSTSAICSTLDSPGAPDSSSVRRPSTSLPSSARSTACSTSRPLRSLARLLRAASGDFERAFWLCGFHAGLRLPGEALGLLWGAVDFDAEVLRPYGNWVRNGYEGRPRPGWSSRFRCCEQLLEIGRQLKDGGWAVAADDFVFTRDQLTGLPADERVLREAFRTEATAFTRSGGRFAPYVAMTIFPWACPSPWCRRASGTSLKV